MLLMALTLLLLSVLVHGPVEVCGEITVLHPLVQSNQTAGLVILPGAFIEAERYYPLAQQIQTDSQYSLWVTLVGGWKLNLVNPLQIQSLVEEAKQIMIDDGMPANSSLFIAAHSLGGTMLDMFIRDNPQAANGIILYGSYISPSVDYATYPVPVLTISGDQDGLLRLTRIAKYVQRAGNAFLRTPVLIIQGVNHSQIASGPMPSNVLKHDIVADLTYEEAHKQLSLYTNAFMTYNGKGLSYDKQQEAVQVLLLQHLQTEGIVDYYLRSVPMDGGGRQSYAGRIQEALSGLNSPSSQLTLQGEETTMYLNPFAAPTVVKVNDTLLNVTLPCYIQTPINPIQTTLIQESPVELWVSLASKPALEKMLPIALFSNDTKECSDANKNTLADALKFLPELYVTRYKNKGRIISFERDVQIGNIFEWMVTPVAWNASDRSVTITSPSYVDEAGSKTFCKVLTLSRVIEYIMVDSFKN